MSHRAIALSMLAVAFVAAAPLSACNRGTVPSGTAFCARVTKHLAELKGPVTDSAAAKRAVAAYKDVATVTPAPVREAWASVTLLVEAAASLDLTSATSQSAFAERAVAADAQITRVADYTRDTCGVELNPSG